MKRTSRKPSNLTQPLQRRLNSYALAATASGVAAVALAQPAEAKIIYTPAKIFIGSGYALDLANDGHANFLIRTGGFVTNSSKTEIFSLVVSAFNITSDMMGRSGVADALAAGRKIGPAGPFLKLPYSALMGQITETQHGDMRFRGPWVGSKGVTNRYLGLRIPINGKPHFGWARLSVVPGSTAATLTGYAYETIPGKAIITGKTKGRDVITVQDGSLGHLARGAAVRAGR